MTSVDTLVTNFSLKDDYTSHANKATASTQRFAQAQNRLHSSIGAGSKQSAAANLSVASSFTSLGSAAALATAGVAAYIAAAQATVGPARAAAEWDALSQSLVAVEGNAKTAQVEMKRLLELARAPGLGQEETIRGYTQLRNAGLDRSLSERLLKEFGNANAKAGGGPEKLGNILAQVSQAASKPYLQGEELSTLTENGIPAYKIVKDALGTSDTEELKKRGVTSVQVLEAIAAALEKTNRVAGSTKNSFDNLDDTLAASERGVGRGLNESYAPLAEKLSDILDLANQGGVFEDFGRSIADALGANEDYKLEDTLVNVIAAGKTAATAFGILRDRIGEVFENLEKMSHYTPGGFIADLYKRFLGGETVFDAEKESTKADMRRGRYDRFKEMVDSGAIVLDEGQKFGKAFEDYERTGKLPSGKKKKEDDSTQPVVQEQKQTTNLLRELVDISRAQLSMMLEDAQNGGGTLAKYAIAGQNVSGGNRAAAKLRRLNG